MPDVARNIFIRDSLGDKESVAGFLTQSTRLYGSIEARPALIAAYAMALEATEINQDFPKDVEDIGFTSFSHQRRLAMAAIMAEKRFNAVVVIRRNEKEYPGLSEAIAAADQAAPKAFTRISARREYHAMAIDKRVDDLVMNGDPYKREMVFGKHFFEPDRIARVRSPEQLDEFLIGGRQKVEELRNAGAMVYAAVYENEVERVRKEKIDAGIIPASELRAIFKKREVSAERSVPSAPAADYKEESRNKLAQAIILVQKMTPEEIREHIEKVRTGLPPKGMAGIYPYTPEQAAVERVLRSRSKSIISSDNNDDLITEVLKATKRDPLNEKPGSVVTDMVSAAKSIIFRFFGRE